MSLIIIFLLSFFMTHNQSAFVWEKVGILRYTQFPWRFLSLSIFSSSLIGGLAVLILKKNLQKYAAFSIIVLTFFLNFNFFKPENFYPLSDSQKLSGDLWDQQRKAAVSDYLPKGAYMPKEPAPTSPLILEGEADIKNFFVKSNSWQFDIDAKSNSIIEIPIFDFPNWEVFVNDEKIKHTNNNLLRRVQFSLHKGSYHVTGKFKDTKIRSVSNLLTLLSVGVLIFLIYGKNRFKNI